MSDEAIPLTREFTVDPAYAARVSLSVDYTYYSRAERDREFVALRRVQPRGWMLFSRDSL